MVHATFRFSGQCVPATWRFLGDLVHRGRATAGVYPSIVSERVWDRAQSVMAPHALRWAGRNRPAPGMLAGLLFGPTGALSHQASVSRGKAYRYYGPPRRLREGSPRSADDRYRAEDLERAVLAAIDPEGRLRRDPGSEPAARDLVASLVERVDVGEDITVRIGTGRTVRIAKAPWLKTSRLRNRPLVS